MREYVDSVGSGEGGRGGSCSIHEERDKQDTAQERCMKAAQTQQRLTRKIASRSRLASLSLSTDDASWFVAMAGKCKMYKALPSPDTPPKKERGRDDDSRGNHNPRA